MRIKNILLGCLVGVSCLLNVNAATLELKSSSSNYKNEIKTGASNEYKLTLKDVGEYKFNLVEFEVEYDSSLKFEGANSGAYDTKEDYSSRKAFISVLQGDFTEFDGKVITSFKLTNNSTLKEDFPTVFKIKNVRFLNGEEVVSTMDSEITENITLKYVETTTEPTTTTTAARVKNTSAKVTKMKFSNTLSMTPAFNSATKEYKLYTKDSIPRVTLTYDTEQEGVELSSNCTLGCSIGTTDSIITLCTDYPCKNEVEFTFTSEDKKNTETYKITIYRGETTDGSNKLASLKVADFDINEKFDAEVIDYHMTVPFEVENLDITATPADSEASVKIKGSEGLKVGENTVTITVIPTDPDEKNKIYNITVVREEFVEEEPTSTVVDNKKDVAQKEEKKNSKSWILISIIIGGLLIIGLSGYFIFFYKGKDKKKKTVVDEIDDMPKMKEKKVIDEAFEDKEPTTVEEALDDLMKTKDISHDDINDESL